MGRIQVACIVFVAASLPAADWLTFSGDAQRTGWAKGETAISKENVQGLKVVWSLKLDNQSREMNGLTVPVIVENVITPRGFKDVVIIAGASDTVHAIDADTGKLLWRKQMTAEGQPRNPGHWLCPNALNATPVVDKKSRTAYVVASDGRLYSLNPVNGEDRRPPIQFVPPYSKNWSLNLWEGMIYTTISQGCNGARSAVYGIDPGNPVQSFIVSSTGGAGIWGRAGAAIGFDGTIYVETGDGPYDPPNGKYSDTFLALSPKDLKLKDYYTPANRVWITKKDLDMGNISPVVFKFKQWELIAGGGKEGRLFLLDSKSLGGADHMTPLYRSVLLTNDDVNFYGRGFWGALSTWESPAGERWLYAPAYGPPGREAPPFPKKYGDTPGGSIMAFTVEEKDGKPVLVAKWISRDMTVPEPVIIANGIVFALANGENVDQVDSGGRLLSSKERIDTRRGNAILYALDAETGRELFSSGTAIPGWTHFSGLAISNGRVYVTTFDSTVYAFGLE